MNEITEQHALGCVNILGYFPTKDHAYRYIQYQAEQLPQHSSYGAITADSLIEKCKECIDGDYGYLDGGIFEGRNFENEDMFWTAFTMVTGIQVGQSHQRPWMFNCSC